LTQEVNAKIPIIWPPLLSFGKPMTRKLRANLVTSNRKLDTDCDVFGNNFTFVRYCLANFKTVKSHWFVYYQTTKRGINGSAASVASRSWRRYEDWVYSGNNGWLR